MSVSEQSPNLIIPDQESSSEGFIYEEIIVDNQADIVNQFLAKGWHIPAVDHGESGSPYHGVSGAEHKVPPNGRRLLFH